MNWKEISEPILSKLGYSSRSQQSLMGDGIVNAINNHTNLIVEAPTGTGKSLAILIPIISKVKETDGEYRAVITTATKSLQDQYVGDLHRLQKNNNFTYASLKGKENYLCFNRANEAARRNVDIRFDVELIKTVASRIVTGERSEIEGILRQRLSNETWNAISGKSIECAENHCKEKDCYGARALLVAKGSNIIITNNAMLRVDAERRLFDSQEGYLGPIDLVAVDEAHELESSLISGWTTSISEWELGQYLKNITTGISVAINKDFANINTDEMWQETKNDLESWIYYFKEYHKEKYGDYYLSTDHMMKMQYIPESSSESLIDSLLYLEENLGVLNDTIEFLEILGGMFELTLDYLEKEKVRGKKEINKALTGIKTLTDVITPMYEALKSEDGVVTVNNIPMCVMAHPYLTKKGELKVRFDSIPIDISSKAKAIWQDRVSILMSATLRDLYTMDFSYIKTALNFPEASELVLTSVFDLQNNQMIYTTPGVDMVSDIKGAQFSLDEMLKLIIAAKGRTLVLFTAKSELNAVKNYLEDHPLSYPSYFQTDDADRLAITNNFRLETNSVLFATKSFFQGVDFKGETLSQVILAKFPLLQYNDFCKNQEIWWRKRGFPRWYDSKSMEVFQQAVGRVLRQETDRGIISILDQRVLQNRSRVSRLTKTLINNLGSPWTQEIETVEDFLQ